jgi:hypothetical protein
MLATTTNLTRLEFPSRILHAFRLRDRQFLNRHAQFGDPGVNILPNFHLGETNPEQLKASDLLWEPEVVGRARPLTDYECLHIQ